VKFLYWLIIALLLTASKCLAAPFGFEYNSTQQQIVAKVGKTHILSRDPKVLVLDTAPKPYWLFHTYTLTFSSSGKLIEIFALASRIVVNSGEEMRHVFSNVRTDVSIVYDKPEMQLDCTVKSEFPADQEACAGDWGHGKPAVFAGWQNSDALKAAHLESIFLRFTTDDDPETADLSISFEFLGAEAAAMKQRKKNSPF
jgi:hypothetical protein